LIKSRRVDMANKTVLVVDDAMFMRKMLSDILSKAGYDVVGEAADGKEALARYKEHRPDIVTMDITMSPVNGIDGCRLITEEDPDAKILMVSAMGQESMVINAIKAGAKGFIVKPFDGPKVINEIQKIVK
jgi:two-component system chemotaxis response regulator CheY